MYVVIFTHFQLLIVPNTAATKSNCTAETQCAALEGECNTLREQFAQAPARRDAMQQRDALQAQLETATAAGTDLQCIGLLGLTLDKLNLKAAQLPLSEVDYLTLAVRHAALVQRVKIMSRTFVQAKQFGLVYRMGHKLKALEGMDLSVLQDTGTNDPVFVENISTTTTPDRAERVVQITAIPQDPPSENALAGQQ